LLQGHERAITQIKYNRDGDLLFSAAKDKQPNVWFAINGERLGTYTGHNGAVWCIDVAWDTQNFMSGSADNTCKIWDCRTGQCKSTFSCATAVRSCGFSFSGNLIMYSTDATMGKECSITVRDLRQDKELKVFDVTPKYPKVTSAVWGPLEDTILTGHDGGELMLWDLRNSGDLSKRTRPHNKQIMDIQKDHKSTCIITASKDCTAKLIDIETLKELKAYRTEKPVNSAAVSPVKDHVLLGGGQEAMDVTTAGRTGKFEARFFHLVFEEEFGRVRDHFGPINSVAFHPDGKSYSSGGEDGYVRVHHFDSTYNDFEFEC